MLYPRTGCAGDAHYELSRVLGFDYGKQKDLQSERTVFLEKFTTEFKKSQCEQCVISSENFVLPRNVELVRNFFSDFDCRIVVYFRRHDHWWISAYNQAVRMVVHPPWPQGFQGFLDFTRKKNPAFGNYCALLDRWAKAFGQENIIVRPYELEQNQPNIVVDFLTAIGSAELCSILNRNEDIILNRSLDIRSTFLLETFQRMDVDDNVRRLLINSVMKNIDLKNNEQIVSSKFRRQLVDAENHQYKYIARKYLNRPDGILFFEPPPDPQTVWVQPKYPQLVEVASIVAQVLSAPVIAGKK